MKTDFSKQYRNYYTAKPKPELIHVEPAVYLSIAGQGDPDQGLFAGSLQALYSMAYGVKFTYKAQGADFIVPKLEGLWWFDEAKWGAHAPGNTPQQVPRSEWFFRLLIRMPETITSGLLIPVRETIAKRKAIPLLDAVGLHRMDEGRCVQMLHTGPFSSEPQTLEKLQAFMVDYQLERNGPHHEIYLSDFRKTAPDRLKTILREPVK